MQTDTQGSCYGFDITSDLPLAFLRTTNSAGTPMAIRSGPPLKDDGTLLQEWNVAREGKLTTRLFEVTTGHYLVRIGNDDSFEVFTETPGIVVHPGAMDEINRESMIWGTPSAASMAHRGRLPFHAGSADINGQGIVFAATGSFGKTTLTGAFHAAGYRSLADDLSCAIIDPEPALLPGPASIRARPDVLEHFPFARTTPVLTTPTRSHLALDPDTRGNGDPVPLRAIVFLRISDGPIILERAPVADVVRDLFGLSYRSPSDEGQAKAFELATGLAGSVPGWNLQRPLTVDSLPTVVETVVGTCLD